jgi:hypothetical protein
VLPFNLAKYPKDGFYFRPMFLGDINFFIKCYPDLVKKKKIFLQNRNLLPFFFTNLFNEFFQKLKLPYVCKRDVNIMPKDKGCNLQMDIVVYDGEDEVLFVKVKDEDSSGKRQVINYSHKFLSLHKNRYMILSMECTTSAQFQFFCTFRLGNEIAFVSLSEMDNFGFRKGCLGLLKLLGVLMLPWPFYGDILSLPLERKSLLGGGSSAEVVEYYDIQKETSVVLKIFFPTFKEEYLIEADILTKFEEITKQEVLWCSSQRLIICTKGVKTELSLLHLKEKHILSLYLFLQEFHKRGYIHRDIHPGNLLMSYSKNGDINETYVNDFGLSVKSNGENEIKGNLHFASDYVLDSLSAGVKKFLYGPIFIKFLLDLY